MRTRAVALAFALLIAAGSAGAQQVSVAATVPVASPTGAGTRNLAFGMVAPLMGQTVAVDVVAAAAPESGTVYAGEFRYDLTGARGLDFVVVVPPVLAGAGGAPLAVSFNGAQYGGYCVTSGGSACALTGFDPAAGANIRVCRQTVGSGTCHPARVFPAGSALAVYIGGRLSVPPTARAGLYTGVITLTIIQVY